MSHTDSRREERIQNEWTRLKDRSQRAGFWSVGELVSTPDGQSLDLMIQGRSIAAAGPSLDRVEYCHRQEISVTLPDDFPEAEPSIRVHSTAFHPNIPADGVVSLRDIGLTWTPDVTLDMIVERLWNTLRGSHVDAANAIQIGAGQWYSGKSARQANFFPVDQRPLFEQIACSRNIVRYRRKGQPYPQYQKADPVVIDEHTTPPSDSSSDSTIFFID